jgi:hypothetical protein
MRWETMGTRPGPDFHAASPIIIRNPIGNENAVTEIPLQECQALVSFYEQTNGAGWVNNANWLDSTTVSDWFGLVVFEGHVTEIELFNNQLSGVIPTCLQDLPYLLVLDLGINTLTGDIPAELGNLTYIRYLCLDENQLTSSIPAAIGNLTLLEELILKDNDLTGSIPTEIGTMTTLSTLDFSGNALTGTVPESFGNLTILATLNLEHNRLTGEIPSSLADLPNLSRVFLSGNALTGAIPPGFGDQSNMMFFEVYGNELTGPIPDSFGNLTNLFSLSLNGNQLTGDIPESLANLTGITYFSLSYNYLQVTGYSQTLEYAQISFQLSARNSVTAAPVTIFDPPLNITVNYDLAILDGRPPQVLGIYFWDDTLEDWALITDDCGGTHTHGPGWVSGPVCHLTEFGLFIGDLPVEVLDFLPMIVK